MKKIRRSGLLASAVGVGVGVGLGLLSARLAASTSGGGATAADVEAELRRLLVDGRETGVTFADFPYYLREETRLALTNAAFPYLSQTVLPKHIDVFDATSRTILLCGQSEPCLLSLAKAVAHQFNARLLALDVLEFMSQIQHKYGGPSNAPVEVPTRSTSESTLDRVYGFVQSLNVFRKKAEPTGSLDHEKATLDLKTSFHYNQSAFVNITIFPNAKNNHSDPMEDDDSVIPLWSLDEKILMQSLYKVIVSASECSPVILYIRDVNVVLASSNRAYSEFQKMLNKLSGRVSIIGSHFLDDNQDCYDVEDAVIDLFPYILETSPPKDAAHLEKWKTQMENDKAKSQIEIITNQVAGFLSAFNLECDDLSSISLDDHVTILSYPDVIFAPAVSYHLMNNNDPEYKNGRLVLSSTSLSHGLKIFQESNLGKYIVERKEASKATKDNEYEKRIRESAVVPASETGVTFDDIGALDDIKESVQELVRLPLQRPDLFTGGLLKPCKGILLFGPPGTGKTMLAKAIANEAGASFMNISMSTIVSKWYGESEKSIRALFSLAEKIAPTVIFVDEVDSMLGTRDNANENEASRRIKNEFMTHWNGLLSKSDQRILVLAATNRPFDLDDAIIRRFEHRMMVGLPTLESRELIFKKLLSKEKVEGVIDFKELAKMTEGYTGSDLKNLCVTAAYRPVRELLKKEKEMKDNKKEKDEKGKKLQAEDPKNQESGKEKPASSKGKEASSEEADKKETEETVGLRPLTMEDLKQAKKEVPASFDGGGAVMNEMKQWNELYGKGGSRKKQQPTYFM